MPAFFFAMTCSSTLRCFALGLAAVGALSAANVHPRMLLLDGTVVGTQIVVVGERGTILRSPDQSVTWLPATVPTTATLTGVSFAPGKSQGWAVGHDALILASPDAGATWRKQWQGENLSDSFLDVLALDTQHVVAIGAYGLFVASADGGKTWVRRKIIDEDFHLNRITRGPAGDLYIAGEHGTLLRSADQGATWQRIAAPYDGSFYGILPLDAQTLVAYGLRGRIYRSSDNGASWTLVPNEQRVLIATAAKLADGTIVFAGQARTGFVSRDGGRTVAVWEAAATAPGIAELLEVSDGTPLVLGEAGATHLPVR